LNSGEYLLFGFPAISKPSCTSIVQEGMPFFIYYPFSLGQFNAGLSHACLYLLFLVAGIGEGVHQQ
jgi:hypothetical protein